MKISNIIFDLGGVILDIDFRLTIEAFKQMGAAEFNFHPLQQWLEEFEIGKLPARQFRTLLSNHYELKITDDQFDEAWNAMLLQLPPERLDLIKKVKNSHGIKTFLLSNTNEIHLLRFRKSLISQLFSECFNKEYYSNELGKRKPNPDAFLTILEDNSLRPSETLFLDDSIQHIESAKELGLQVELITSKMTLCDVLKKLEKK